MGLLKNINKMVLIIKEIEHNGLSLGTNSKANLHILQTLLYIPLRVFIS